MIVAIPRKARAVAILVIVKAVSGRAATATGANHIVLPMVVKEDVMAMATAPYAMTTRLNAAIMAYA
jgi:hypothetical protein